MTRGLMRRIRPKKSTTKTLVTPIRIPIEASAASLVEKVALENGRQRKLTARAVIALNNSNEKVADPKYQNWSHQPITFSRADQ
jgi:hypothetical protein